MTDWSRIVVGLNELLVAICTWYWTVQVTSPQSSKGRQETLKLWFDGVIWTGTAGMEGGGVGVNVGVGVCVGEDTGVALISGVGVRVADGVVKSQKSDQEPGWPRLLKARTFQ